MGTTISSPAQQIDQILIVEHGFEGPPGDHGAPGDGRSGLVFVTDVIPLDNKYIGEKFYKSGTVPSNVVLDSITTNSYNFRVKLVVISGFDTYTPEVFLQDTPVLNLVESDTKRYYYAEQDIVVTDDDLELVASLGNGSSTSLSIIRKSDLGPTITDVYFGTYPGGQVELKEGDQVEVHCIVSLDADTVQILESDAVSAVTLNVDVPNSGGIGLRRASGFITIKNATGQYKVDARAVNAASIPGDIKSSNARLELNQTEPSVSQFVILYENGNSAALQYETVYINLLGTNFDTVIYSSSSLTIPNHRVYEEEKPATVISTSSGQVQVTLIREANNAIVVRSLPLLVASNDLSAVLMVESEVPLIKSDEGSSYKIVLKANQPLLNLPQITFNVNTVSAWVYNVELNQYESTVVLYENESYTSLELFDGSITGLTGIVSTNLHLDKSYPIIPESSGRIYVQAEYLTH